VSRAVGYAGSLLAACLALYVVLISTVTPLEWAVGAGLALCAAAMGLGAHRLANRPTLTPHTSPDRAVRLARAWVLDAPHESVALARLVVARMARRHVGGRFEQVRTTGAVHPAAAAFVLSATPGAFAVDLDGAGVILVHTLPLGRSRVRRVITGDDGRAR
jgi:Na+/H+ ion antiporter subunit